MVLDHKSRPKSPKRGQLVAVHNMLVCAYLRKLILMRTVSLVQHLIFWSYMLFLTCSNLFCLCRNRSDPNTIFRGNSLASKCVDEYMKLDGLYYLYDTLQVLLDDIFENKKSCEVDPTKLKDGESLETNMVCVLSSLSGYWCLRFVL